MGTILALFGIVAMGTLAVQMVCFVNHNKKKHLH